jgi:hypothetical protein
LGTWQKTQGPKFKPQHGKKEKAAKKKKRKKENLPNC